MAKLIKKGDYLLCLKDDYDQYNSARNDIKKGIIVKVERAYKKTIWGTYVINTLDGEIYSQNTNYKLRCWGIPISSFRKLTEGELAAYLL